MNRTLTISDALFERLEGTAQAQGLESIDQPLEESQAREDELRGRQETVCQIDALREVRDTVALRLTRSETSL